MAAKSLGEVDEREYQNALDWFFHQMDLAFAGIMLAVYAFYDTVMKFIGIKVSGAVAQFAASGRRRLASPRSAPPSRSLRKFYLLATRRTRCRRARPPRRATSRDAAIICSRS